MANHIAVDIETWGLGPYSVIVSIGAVEFDPHRPGELGHTFEVAIDPVSSQRAGLRIEADTVAWWMASARNEAREHWLGLLKFDVQSALSGFAQWLDVVGPAKDRLIWGNGANFDNVRLIEAYKLINMEEPWKHWQDRCFRTIKSLDAGNRRAPPGPAPLGVKHTALYDAAYQALWMQNIVHINQLPII